jgi:hypothetical protein
MPIGSLPPGGAYRWDRTLPPRPGAANARASRSRCGDAAGSSPDRQKPTAVGLLNPHHAAEAAATSWIRTRPDHPIGNRHSRQPQVNDSGPYARATNPAPPRLTGARRGDIVGRWRSAARLTGASKSSGATARCATSRAGSSGGRRRTESSWCLTVERCRRHGSAGTAPTAAIDRDERRPPTGRVSQPRLQSVRDAVLAHAATSDRPPRRRGGVQPVRPEESSPARTPAITPTPSGRERDRGSQNDLIRAVWRCATGPVLERRHPDVLRGT